MLSNYFPCNKVIQSHLLLSINSFIMPFAQTRRKKKGLRRSRKMTSVRRLLKTKGGGDGKGRNRMITKRVGKGMRGGIRKRRTVSKRCGGNVSIVNSGIDGVTNKQFIVLRFNNDHIFQPFTKESDISNILKQQNWSSLSRQPRLPNVLTGAQIIKCEKMADNKLYIEFDCFKKSEDLNHLLLSFYHKFIKEPSRIKITKDYVKPENSLFVDYDDHTTQREKSENDLQNVTNTVKSINSAQDVKVQFTPRSERFEEQEGQGQQEQEGQGQQEQEIRQDPNVQAQEKAWYRKKAIEEVEEQIKQQKKKKKKRRGK